MPDHQTTPLFMKYHPDLTEEAYYASPEGLRASARMLRQAAARNIERARELEAEAKSKEASARG